MRRLLCSSLLAASAGAQVDPGRLLTPHQLLSQTAGLRDEPGGDGTQEESALGEGISAWGEERLFLAPGRAFSYSNPSYALAGFVLE